MNILYNSLQEVEQHYCGFFYKNIHLKIVSICFNIYRYTSGVSLCQLSPCLTLCEKIILFNTEMVDTCTTSLTDFIDFTFLRCKFYL